MENHKFKWVNQLSTAIFKSYGSLPEGNGVVSQPTSLGDTTSCWTGGRRMEERERAGGRNSISNAMWVPLSLHVVLDCDVQHALFFIDTYTRTHTHMYIIKICVEGGFQKQGYPKIIRFNRIFHSKPSMLGYLYLGKSPKTPARSVWHGRREGPKGSGDHRRSAGSCCCVVNPFPDAPCMLYLPT